MPRKQARGTQRSDGHGGSKATFCQFSVLSIFTVNALGGSVLPALSVAENATVVIPSAVITIDASLPRTIPTVD
jgi:hypothetical protein